MTAQYPATPGFKASGTSQEAAEAIRPSCERLRTIIKTALNLRGPMTADECAEHLGYSILSVRPRFTELNKTGQIEKTGERRRNASGMSASVWRLVAPPMPLQPASEVFQEPENYASA